MSYPSIKSVDLELLDETAQEDALWNAFHADLPLGMQELEKDAEEVKKTGERKLTSYDPNSPLGKQLIRLLGTDIARGIIEKRMGIALGMYNCCGKVVAPQRAALHMTMREQIMLQNGKLASADC